ncbi:MAG: FecR domain-containing protein, partial [Bacteroidales bacterium]|nr:FecR domain-containing protein [Bacteroidales bacterium]
KEEIELMKEIYSLSDNDLELLIDRYYDTHPVSHSIDRKEADIIFNKIIRKSRRKGSKYILKRVVSVAASLIIALTAIYFAKDYFKQETNDYWVSRDIKPGGEKALLTLSDGTVVDLSISKDSLLLDKKNNVTIRVIDNKLVIDNIPKTKSAELRYSTLTTPRAGEFQMTLPDGTGVWLNAESSIKFPETFSEKERKVYITGEVYFEVAKTADKRPFIVELTDKAKIEVLGTHFNVNAYDNEGGVRTTLLEGSVKVESAMTGVYQVISPGQQATITESGNITVDKVDIDEAIAWKNGRFIFEKADIQSIMRQLERWYNIKFEVQGEIKSHFGGAISRKVNISRIFEMLEMTNEVKFRLDDSTVIVLDK